MASSPPRLLCRNLFDTVQQYPLATVSASSEQVGREARRVGAYRRGRQWHEPQDAGTNPTGNWVRTDLGVGNTAAPTDAFIDRTHNLWGRTVYIEGSADGVTWPVSVGRTVAALSGTAYVPGGDPTSVWCVTEEGALWTRFPATTAYRYWRLRVPYSAAWWPVWPGIILGAGYQLTGYLASFDEDASERKVPTDESASGNRATGTVYSWRVLDLALSLIGATEYDAETRALRSLMFTRDVPAVIVPEPGGHPERAWMYKVDGTSWRMPKTKVYRAGTHRMREYLAKTGGS
jgi:hypothetical protein